MELKCIASGNPDPTITWTRQVKSFVFFFAKKNLAELIKSVGTFGCNKFELEEKVQIGHICYLFNEEFFFPNSMEK